MAADSQRPRRRRSGSSRGPESDPSSAAPAFGAIRPVAGEASAKPPAAAEPEPASEARPAPRRRSQSAPAPESSSDFGAGTDAPAAARPAAAEPEPAAEQPSGPRRAARSSRAETPQDEAPQRRKVRTRSSERKATEEQPEPPAEAPAPRRSTRRAPEPEAAPEAEPAPAESHRGAIPPPTPRAVRVTDADVAAPELESKAGVLHYKGLKLSQFQLQAVKAIQAGHNVLVSAPTGAGKTLVAEYAIEDAVKRGLRCIYTAPIKALSNQKYRDFRDEPNVDVGLMTGDVTINPHAQVLIMTTEILRNSIFEDPRNLADVAYVIFDEVHYMDDPERGTVWEESLIFAPDKIRFICLSATVRNLDELSNWLGEIREADLELVKSDKRPVPLEHTFFAPGIGHFPGTQLKRARAQIDRIPSSKPKRSKGKGGRGGRGRDDWQERRQAKLKGETSSMNELLDLVEERQLLPALIFCFSRKDCERLAGASSDRSLLNPAEQERMRVLQAELLESFQLDEGELRGEIFTLSRRGIGYHHAGMLPVHKEVIERMFTSGLLKLLFTTETFAVGINMPARTAIFYGLRKFDGVSFDYLRTRDYLQMAGRAGRQGIDDKGLVISRLDARDLEEAPLERLLAGKPEPVESRFRLTYSSILHLLERLGREKLMEAWEKSFNQYQHRAGNKKAREQNRREQRRIVEAHLELLLELGHIDENDKVTDKGEMARVLYGYELQLTEFLWRGALEDLEPTALAMVFVALVFESRRRFDDSRPASKLHAGTRRHLDGIVRRLSEQERNHGIPAPLKSMDWGLTPGVVAWAKGAPFSELEELIDATPGDVVRCMRMAVQLMRQVRRSIDPKWALADRLQEAQDAINRDEVDARRQLELG